MQPSENGTVVLEPPHFFSGIIGRDYLLGRVFLFNKGFRHASVGDYLPQNNLAGTPPAAPEGTAFHEILQKFTIELRERTPAFLGRVERIYALGFSMSGAIVRDVYPQFGHKLFDISFPCTASYLAPVKPAGAKPIMVFNTEFDFDVDTIVDPAFPNYRWYAAAGAPHIPDNTLTRTKYDEDPKPPPPFNPAASKIRGTTPIDWAPFFKALFVAGDQWVRNGTLPPASAVLKVVPGKLLARDIAGNAVGGIRHPALELREATFIASVFRGRLWEFFGAYGKLRTFGGLRPFPDFENYKTSFRDATENLARARLLSRGWADIFIRRSMLEDNATYTMNYMWERFYKDPSRMNEDEITP